MENVLTFSCMNYDNLSQVFLFLFRHEKKNYFFFSSNYIIVTDLQPRKVTADEVVVYGMMH